ncbi:transferrin-binding protein-like solute binding protein [Psychrobacter sp. KFRI-CH2-11]|uniref:transferrin-binding protein-like solute binding protein n=1 Tax=Psychrobacter sp. KFRI-CH2-11 TaxID=3156079 RepID=UPI003249663C
MKQKYLALALSAVFATALAGCGSDNDSNYNPQTETPDTETPDTETPDTETPDTETPDTETPDVPGADEDSGITDPAEGGNFETDKSVVGQQYIRGSSSKFDFTEQTNSDIDNDGSSTVTNFKELQNKKMTNIVVAQYADKSNPNSDGTPGVVQYILGAKPNSNPDVVDEDSLQQQNDLDALGAFVNVTKTQEENDAPSYNITGVESITDTAKNNTNITEGYEDSVAASVEEKNNVRIFGALSGIDGDNVVNNSSAYYVNDNKGNSVDLNANDYDTDGFDVKGIKLNNVQYGRVTGNLESKAVSEIAGKSYVKAKFADKDIAGNTSQTDIYFYRGLNATDIDTVNSITTGKYQYAGHALMYGIDNSYNGKGGAGDSNSVAFGNNGEAIGNFVQAEFDAETREVKGSIYNVWNRDTVNDNGDTVRTTEQVDLVDFGGNVKGNTIIGDANLTYDETNKGSFKGSFFGDNAEEMGGALNSISSQYGKSEWGGVFGAQQLAGDKPTVTPTPDDTVPPIFNTGKDSKK